MGDLVIEAGAFKVGASSKDAQALLREKLDQDGILADIAQIDNEVGELTTLARPSPTLALHCTRRARCPSCHLLLCRH